MRSRWLLSVVLAVGVVVAAGVWVSAVRFTDARGAYDCGVPIGAARHGYQVPKFVVHVETTMMQKGATSGLFGLSRGDLTTVCRGEARTRVAIAVGAIVAAGVGLVFARHRWGGSAEPPAIA